jgi:predicted permease
VLQNLRYAFRTLGKSPGFALAAILSLALGIGANTAIFSVADALLLRPLPVADPGEVVTVVGRTRSESVTNISYRDYVDFRDNAKQFSGMAAFSDTLLGFAARPDELPQMRLGMLVSGNFFDVMRVKPILGRAFGPTEDQAPGRDRVVVLGYDTWEKSFARDPQVLGKTIRLNGVEMTVIGVMPEEFTALNQYSRSAFFLPLMMQPALSAGGALGFLENRNHRVLEVKGRLAPGAGLKQAEAELAGIAAGLEKRYPDTNRDRRAAVLTELQIRIERSPPDAALVAMLMGLVAVVLLVACTNVASLLLSRARDRAQEIAVRLAIGCGRARLVGQLLTESLLLALAGGAAGLLLGYGGVRFFSRIQLPTDLPFRIDVQLDERALAFTLLASLFSVLLFGLAPAIRASRASVIPALKNSQESSRRARLWGRNSLVAGQIALSIVLLVVASTLMRGFRILLKQSPGFRTDRLLMMTFDPSLVRYSDSQTREFFKQLVERARLAPGVQSAALTRVIPMGPDQHVRNVAPEGYQFPQGKETATHFANVVGDGYFQTMRVPMVKGRAFLPTDTADSPRVAIVNEEFASRYWPNQEAVGKRFRLNRANGPWVEVVGVSKTGVCLWIAEPPTPFLYLPLAQNPQERMTLIAESAGESSALAAPLREVVRSLDPNLPVFDVRTMESFYEMRAVSTPTMIIQTVGIMGLMGLLLAVSGLFGLVSYSVSRRTREIGIRMAIGADRLSVLGMVLRQGLGLGVAGVVIGIGLSLAAGPLVLSVFGAAGNDPWSYVIVVVCMLAVTMAASFLPARRASKVDPIRALRYE